MCLRKEKNDSISATAGHLTTRSTIANVLAHPAFEGFSQYILPLEWGYDADMPLADVAQLLPYHNYIDAERCVGYINQMIDSVAAGRRIYYDLGRKDAGLFFFPWTAWCAVCGRLSRRRIFVCRLHPRGLSPCLSVEPDGVQCVCHPIPDRQCTDGLRGLSGGHRIHLPPRHEIAGRYSGLLRVGAVRPGHVWLHTSVHTERRLSVRHSFPVRARW